MSELSTAAKAKLLPDEELDRVAGGRYRGAVFMYTLQSGDSLSVLAHRYGTTIRVLRELNDITEPDMLVTGSTIMIPQK